MHNAEVLRLDLAPLHAEVDASLEQIQTAATWEEFLLGLHTTTRIMNTHGLEDSVPKLRDFAVWFVLQSSGIDLDAFKSILTHHGADLDLYSQMAKSAQAVLSAAGLPDMDSRRRRRQHWRRHGRPSRVVWRVANAPLREEDEEHP
jgi:hypothetical protein